MNILRQGDVLLIEVAHVPAGAKEETPEGRVVLMFGEVTGHAHAIEQTRAAPKVRVWSAAGERFIQAIADAPLVHEEHSTHVLPAGSVWRQIYQVEERGEEVRRVAD